MSTNTYWIKLHTDLPRHPQTLNLSRQMGLTRRETVGLLIDLWTWALDAADRDGRLEGVTAEDLAAVLELRGKRKALLVPALTQAGFLEQDGETLVLHNWYAYTGRLNDTREKNRERMRRHRAEKTADEAASKSSSDPDEGEDVTRTTVSCNGDVTRTTALRHAVRQEETRQEKDVVSDETTTGGGSLPPSLSEIEKFCRQKGGTEAQAAAFFAQYSAADWRANGAPIASWQGLLTNFLRQGGQFHPSCASSPPKKPGEKSGEKLYVPENAKKNAAWMMRVLAESGDLP